MNKRALIAEIVGVSFLFVSLILFYLLKDKQPETVVCSDDVMICADGSEVRRVPPMCDFAVCPDIQPQKVGDIPQPPVDPNSFEPEARGATTKVAEEKQITPTAKEPSTPSFIQKVITVITSILPTSSQKETTVETQANNSQPSSLTQEVSSQESTYNDNRYTIINNTITDQEGNSVASLPSSSYTPPTTSGSDWQTHTVNAIDVGSTTPVINGIPVVGSAGKYYVSENSFGDISLCEFSNRIYLLDTINDTKELLYEENSSTLSKDDPRACNSEIFLLATEDNNLILKYHTINTNMICESTWSEPDRTWYLNVSSFASGMKRYQVTTERYENAEAEEIVCRTNLGAATTSSLE